MADCGHEAAGSREPCRLRIALFVERLPDTGGGFHQVSSTIESLTRSRATDHEFVVFTQFARTTHRRETLCRCQRVICLDHGKIISDTSDRSTAFPIRRFDHHSHAVRI